jgi:hypothetical protein
VIALRRVVILGALGSAALAAVALAQSRGFVRPAPLRSTDIGDRLRVFAKAGDYKLENQLVTAVVRRKDGWLTEFWQNRARLPTAPQLGTVTDIDGLWQVHPIVFDTRDRSSAPFVAHRVIMLEQAVEAEYTAELGGLTYRARTAFRLATDAPRLELETRFSVDGGQAPSQIGFGDAVKWGNVAYWVEGAGRPRSKLSAPARWIGRRGAGGDLLLESPEPMWIDYEARASGFQPTIHAVYHRGGIKAGTIVSARRAFSYRALPITAARQLPQGMLDVEVTDEARRPLAAKLRFERLGHKDPPFDDDGGLEGAERFAWTGNGQLQRELGPGTYRVLVSSGVERDVASFDVVIVANRTTRREVRLPRVVATPGWVGCDLHLHQAPSVDADISLPARVVSVAAEGVEFAVATDHYVVTDLAPTVRWLRDKGILSTPLTTVVGSEVSTLGNRFGHFNVFPLKTGDNVVYQDTTPGELFRDARRKSPGGVLQVNHPRWEANLGYFTRFGIDDATGAMSVPGYDPRFDTIEVYNGDDAHDLDRVRRVLVDWLHLLGRGQRYAATGSSDSHKLAFLDPGLPRTLVRHGGVADDARDVAAPVPAVLAAIKAGRSIVTSGPILDVAIAGAGPGETARVSGGRATLRVAVRAAPWIDVRRVEVLEGGNGTRIKLWQIARKRAVERLNATLEIPVTQPTFVVITAEGDDSLPNASRPTRPFGFSNPIWIQPVR